jgi:FkbM family methyltransferase
VAPITYAGGVSATRVGRRLLQHPFVEPLVSTGLLARHVTAPVRFALADTLGGDRVVAHRLRSSGLEVLIEHGSLDVHTFDEIFHRQIYAPPPEVDSALAGLGRALRILDVGANIGLFGAWALGRWPDALVEAYEPDPRNAALHRRTIGRNRREGVWTLHEAAAAAQDGTLRFAAGRYVLGRPADPGDAAAVVVRKVDVLPSLLASDLVKIDAEGSEWEILGDPRFVTTAARAIALEYHPDLCPDDDARAVAAERLQAAGFEVRDVPTPAPPGYGSVWAWRPG